MKLPLLHFFSGTILVLKRALVTFIAKVMGVSLTIYFSFRPQTSLSFLCNCAYSMQLGVDIELTMLAKPHCMTPMFTGYAHVAGHTHFVSKCKFLRKFSRNGSENMIWMQK